MEPLINICQSCEDKKKKKLEKKKIRNAKYYLKNQEKIKEKNLKYFHDHKKPKTTNIETSTI